MNQQAVFVHPLGFKRWRLRNRWSRGAHRFREAWWVLIGRYSLHSAWQVGYDQGTAAEWHRTIVMGGR